MSSRRSREAGEAKGPQVDARQQVLAERALRDCALQVAVGAGDQLEVALHLPVGADGQEALLLDGAQQHRLLVEAELADLVEEQHAAVGRAQQPGAIRDRAGEGALARGRTAPTSRRRRAAWRSSPRRTRPRPGAARFLSS